MVELSVKYFVPTILMAFALVEAGYFLFQRFVKRANRKQVGNATILFFPDSKIACKQHFTSRHGCTTQRCKFAHDENLSYGQLMKVLTATRLSMDICVYCITSNDMAQIILQLHENGVIVRIITDYGQMEANGSQIGKFRAHGIQVRYGSTSFYMHHKFVILDYKLLVNGSFNWTRNAILGNNENVQIMSDSQLVETYQQEFDKLWNLFDPQNLKK